MKRALMSVAAVLAMVGASLGEPPPEALVQALSKTIRNHCPEAKIEVTKDEFVAKYATMMFTLHSVSMTGEVSPNTYQWEGPNYKGFILRVSLQDGEYRDQAAVPQTSHGPYFATFIDGPATDDGKKHYWVSFSYGGDLDPALKKAIFETIPKATFPQRRAGDAGKPQATP